MALGWGAGAELRKPLGIAIVGGLVVSQMLTLFTTPVIYLYLDRLRNAFDVAEAELSASSRCSRARRGRGRQSLMTRHDDAGRRAAVLCRVPHRSALSAAGGTDASRLQGNGGQRSVEDGDAERRPAEGQVVGDVRRSAVEHARGAARDQQPERQTGRGAIPRRRAHSCAPPARTTIRRLASTPAITQTGQGPNTGRGSGGTSSDLFDCPAT